MSKRASYSRRIHASALLAAAIETPGRHPDPSCIGTGEGWLNALNDDARRTGQLVCVCGEDVESHVFGISERLVLEGFAGQAMRRENRVPTLLISSVHSAEDLTRRVVCFLTEVSYFKLCEGFITAAKRKELAQTAKSLADAPLFAVETSGSPTPWPLDTIEEQLQLWTLAEADRGLVILHGIRRFLEDAPEGEALKSLLEQLQQLCQKYVVTIVVMVPVIPKNSAGTEWKPTRLRWVRSLPPEVMDTADMVMLTTALNFTRQPEPDDDIWQVNVLKRQGPSTEIPVSICESGRLSYTFV